MDKQTIASFAEATAHLISVRASEPRTRVVAMLRAWDLSEVEADAVISEGLARGLFTTAGPTADLRAPQAKPPEPSPYMPTPEELFPLLLTHMPIVTWVIDTKGLFVRYEGRGIERLGVPQGFLVGKNYFELFSEHSSAKDVHKALAGEVSHSFTIYEGVPYENWCAPIRDEKNDVKWIVFISLDITEAKATEQELRDKIALVEEQQRVIRELSTPIIQVWDRVLLLPLLGVIDRARAADLMTNLLDQITRTQSQFAILDLTGVTALDTESASALLGLVSAIRLLGAEGIVVGIQATVAHTMVDLGINVGSVITRANLRSALALCMRLMRA